jgi:hypothetical protein
MGLQYEEDNSLSQRIQRELRNPSKRSVLVIIVVILLIISPFVAGWVSSAQIGIDEVTADHDLSENMSAGVADLTDEQVAPWLISQANIMTAATTPLDWEIGNFFFGVCSDGDIGALSVATYRAAIDSACGSLADIQGKHGRDCYIASNCEVKQAAKDEIAVVIDSLWSAHSEAGYVRP